MRAHSTVGTYASDMSDTGRAAEQECEWQHCDRVFVRKGQQGGQRRRFCSNACRTKHSQWLDWQATQYPELAVRRAATRAIEALSTSRAESSLPMMSPAVQANYLKARDVLGEIVERLPDELPDKDPSD